MVSVHGKGFDRFSEKALNRGLYNFTNQMAMDMDRFVPFKQDNLSRSVHVQDNHVTYTTPYAKAQFYGFINDHPITHWTTSEHPQATSRWDLKAKSLYSNNWVRVFKKGLLDGKVVEYHGPEG
ncbi:minor capsid protein [Ligilactobacillus salivarius]|uniref:minor capsid protein n=1 Tax=Ligilactobacillus salivarius TaxID=1624 RepID=UPI0030DD30F2